MANYDRMKLAAYLSREKISAAAFAERLGVPASTVSRIINGQRTPRLETIARIATLTGDEVSFLDFIEIEVAA